MLLIKGQHLIVDKVGAGDRRFGVIQLGVGHLAICIDVSLLVNPSHALDGSNIEGALRA